MQGESVGSVRFKQFFRTKIEIMAFGAFNEIKLHQIAWFEFEGGVFKAPVRVVWKKNCSFYYD